MEPYVISDDLWLCEQAAYLPKLQTLVVSDLQLGHEQMLRDQGASVLLEQGPKIAALLARLIDQTSAKRIVIDGDLKHEFGRVSFQERRDILQLLRGLKERCDVVVVKGNHDTMTRPLTDELGLPLVPLWVQDGFYIVHGHELPKKGDAAFAAAHTVIIGHAHPAITISDGVRKERYKCFLLGQYKKKRLLVLPSCSTVIEGTDILQGASNSPFLQVDSSTVFVLEDTIRPFGRVSDLRRVLG